MNSRRVEASLWFLALALPLALGLYRISALPGLHFDEAWAMNHAYRIAFEPGFWPLTAMSPYTAPWAHYWAALWMRLFGPSLAVYRGSQLELSLLGLGFFAGALPRSRRLGFLWAALLLPGLWLNHRFAVELTGFHVLCFGLAVFAMARARWWWAAGAALAGTTAHVLFYGTAVGLLAAVLLSGRKLGQRTRLAFFAYFCLAALFFQRVLSLIPEKGKGTALVASALLGAGLIGLKGEGWPLWRWRGWLWLVALLGAGFVANAVFFSQGFWSLALFSGREPWADSPFLVCLAAAAASVLFLLGYGLRGEKRRLFALWFLSALAFSGLMMLKPAPRYYELPLLALAYFCAEGWQELSLRPRRPHAVVLLANCALVAGLFAFGPGAAEPPVERPLHFLVFRDSSRDYLSAQRLAAKLGGMGCKVSDIGIGDSRVRESLVALARRDWPLAGAACPGPWGLVRRDYLREIGSGVKAGDIEFADFVVQRR